jgi:hypothetical protein
MQFEGLRKGGTPHLVEFVWVHSYLRALAPDGAV